MSFAYRFKTRRMSLQLTQAEVAEIADVTQQAIMYIEAGKTRTPRNIISLAKALQCTPEWLLYGKQPELKNVAVTNIGIRKIPLINYVQAGCWTTSPEIKDHEGGTEYVVTNVDWSTNTFALRIEGDSMEPEFKEGDIVVIDPEIYPSPGEFIVARNGAYEATFKKYRPMGVDEFGHATFELIPLNNDYPVIRSTDTPIAIIGTMVEHRIFRRKR